MFSNVANFATMTVDAAQSATSKLCKRSVEGYCSIEEMSVSCGDIASCSRIMFPDKDYNLSQGTSNTAVADSSKICLPMYKGLAISSR